MAVKEQRGNNAGKNIPEEIMVPPPQSPKKKRKGLVILLLLLVCLAGGGVFFATGWGQERSGGETEAAAAEPPAFTFELPELVYNLAGTARPRFLSIKLSLAYTEPGLEAEIEQRLPQIRDALLGLMMGKTEADVTEISKIERMREEIRDATNNILQGGEVTDVYFWHVMIQ